MRKFIPAALVIITVLALLFSFLPINSVQAKQNTEIVLDVRNRTGDTISLKLIDENGNARWFVFQPGLTPTPLPEGGYTFYASTVCGNRTGVFNLNVTKELLFDCRGGSGDSLGITLWRPIGNPAGNPACGTYAWYDGDGGWHAIGTAEVEPWWVKLCFDGVVLSPQ
jgi:hypothetical protein